MARPLVIERPKRWDNPFDPEIREIDVERILSLDMFAKLDIEKFPASAPLRDIVRNDTRFRRYRNTDVIVREGDFGTSAFLVVSGEVGVVPVSSLPDSILGRANIQKQGWLTSLALQWKRPRVPEVRDADALAMNRADGQYDLSPMVDRNAIKQVEMILSEPKTITIGSGQMFGEIAALTRSSRITSVVAKGDVEILEIRRQGIRDIRRWDENFRRQVDKLYRENSLAAHLRQTPIFSHLDDVVIKEIAAKTLFESYGDFDWHISFNRMVEAGRGGSIDDEPLIATEGDYPDGLLMVRSGFARVSRRINFGQRTLRYLGAGEVFGLEEIFHNWKGDDTSRLGLQHSLRAIGYVDILRVPTSLIELFVLPTLPESQAPRPVERRFRNLPRKQSRRITAEHQPVEAEKLSSVVTEALVEYRYFNGRAAMVIDLDRCVRCDACVDACAKGHNNNPRFIRHGRTFGHYMVANACMHCVDPVCMIGCPTGAIHRDQEFGQVVINDATCIGCTTCASNCPYDNIRMVEIRDKNGEFIRDSETNSPVVRATKCDLCVGQPGGPACERACPHDALTRLDMGDVDAITDWFSRK